MSKLKEMCQLLSDRKRWTQRVSARDNRSRDVEVMSPRAVKFCLAGALQKVYGGIISQEYVEDYNKLEMAAKEKTGNKGFDVVLFNDTSTHKQIVELCETLVTI